MPGPLLLVGGVLASIGGLMGISPLRDISNRLLYTGFPTAIPQHPELIQMLFRKLISLPDFNSYMRQNGHNEDWTEALFDNSYNLLNAFDLITLKRREKITVTEFEEYYGKIKYSKDDMNKLELVSEFYPPPADLIRFAVREIYNDEIRQEFGMDLDWPPRFGVEAAKVAIPEQLAKDFWAAHWELPSIRQGYEMLHRDVIDENKLDLLMKALDIMPGWRESLKEISYSPYTRVDVRRMHKAGVLATEEVTRAYKDIGYNQERADNLTDFTVSLSSESKVDLTKTSIVNAFMKGVINKDELNDNLKKIGLSDDTVEFWKSYAEYEKASKLFEDWLNVNIKLYAESIISKDELNVLLNSQNLDSTYINTILAKADLAKMKNIKLPTKADLAKWFIADKITVEEYASKMLDLGYTEADVLNYIEIVKDGIEPQ